MLIKRVSFLQNYQHFEALNMTFERKSQISTPFTITCFETPAGRNNRIQNSHKREDNVR